MSTTRSILEIGVTSDASDATAEFDKVAASASEMGDKIDSASRVADTAGTRLDGAAAGADNLDSKAAAATGSLGALSSGFELVGLDKYATGLQSAAMATDFFSGIGQGLNLVLESQAIQSIKNTAIKAKDIAVTGALAVATGAQTAAQWALNVALNANPIALVVIAAVALIAGLVLLYKHSERFRTIANAAFRAVKTYVLVATIPIRTLIGVVVDVARWVRDIPSAFSAMKATAVSSAEAVTGKVQALIGKVTNARDWVKTKLPEAFDWAKDKAVSAVETITDPIVSLTDFVGDLIDKIGDIHWPEPPGWVKDIGGAIGGIFSIAGKASPTDEIVTGTGFDPRPPLTTQTVEITVQGAVDKVGTAQQIKDLLEGSALWSGARIGFSQ